MKLKIRFLPNFEILFRLRLDRNRILKISLRIRLGRIRNFGKIDNSAEKIRFVRALCRMDILVAYIIFLKGTYICDPVILIYLP